MLADLHCAAGRDDVLRRLVDAEAVIIAGGTDFVPMYAAGAIAAERAVDITGVPELRGIHLDGTLLRIGAAARLAEVARLDVAFAASVSDGAALVGSEQTRARATLGGNICRASPSGDTLPGILTTQAELVLSSAGGQRRVPAHAFFVGPGRTVCRPDEVLERVDIPVRPSVSAYARSTVRNAMDLATVGVAVTVELADSAISAARVAVGGAGPRPLLIAGVDEILSGRAVSDLDGAVAAIDALVQEQMSPIDDTRGSAWYRRQLIAPLLQSVLATATLRAKEH